MLARTSDIRSLRVGPGGRVADRSDASRYRPQRCSVAVALNLGGSAVGVEQTVPQSLPAETEHARGEGRSFVGRALRWSDHSTACRG